jgi:hypothetical protein
LDEKLYRCGFRGKVSRNNLANTNEKRNWQIYHDFAQVLIAKARQLYADEDFGVTLKNTVYASGAADHIRHGQRLHRFCNIIQFFKEQLLLCYSGKTEHSLLSQVFSSDKQDHRITKRSDNKTDRAKNFKTLSRTTKANQFSRRRSETHFCVSDQQFSTGRTDCLPALQVALADRTFLQVDQTALADKVIFRYFNERCQDSDLDSNQCICACGDNQKGTEIGAFVTRNTPNPKHPAFRENPAKTSTYGKLLYF